MNNDKLPDNLRVPVGIKKNDEQSRLSRNSRNSLPDDRTEGDRNSLPPRPYLMKGESTPNNANETDLNGFRSIDSANFVM